MTVTRQSSRLEEEIGILGSLVDQYKDDFALPQKEADLLVSCYEETKRHFVAKENDVVRRYAQRCHNYYSAQQQDGFFNDDEIGRRIFTEVATQYLKISEMVKA